MSDFPLAVTLPLPLLETCLESGALSAADVESALIGRHASQQVKAFVSLLEYKITTTRQESETKGLDATLRAEACGASRALVELRRYLIDLTSRQPDQPSSQP